MTTFADLGLDPKILNALDEAGYTEPTPIQAGAIPEALAGRDVLGIAQTGTGKTASFTLPMIHRLGKGRARARMPRSLVLAPTRELAAQVADNFEKYGKNHKLTMALLIGGVSFGDQDAKLTRGVDVLIATPGRLIDHFERGRLLLTGIEVMVVDEADRMLDMGFIPDIERIFGLTPMTRQTLFFSATMPPEIQRITNQFLNAPVRIEASKPATTADTITQKIVRMKTRNDGAKRAALRALISRDDVKNGIIFCNRKTTVDIVAKSLQKHDFNARPLHGDLAQAFRMETLDKFREGEVQFLVASDVAARGLDIPAVSHVFNFDAPIHSDDYVHRIGRTGRAGMKGAAYMLLTPEDEKFYKSILKTIGSDGIEEMEIEGFDEESAQRPGRSKERGKSRDRDRGRNRDRNKGRAKDQNWDQDRDTSRSGDRDGDERPARSARKKAGAPQDGADQSSAKTPENAPREDQASTPTPSRETDQRDSDETARRAKRGERDSQRRNPRRASKTDNHPRDGVKGFGDAMPAFMNR